MYTYQKERLPDIKDELAPLLSLHWEEIARHRDEIKLNVDWATYLELDALGILHITTARCDGRLIGYVINFVTPHLHYRDWVMANNDILFVHPDYRKGRVFLKLLNYTEQLLADRGVKNLYIHMKTAHDFSPILERLGYTEIERNFEKQLT